MFLASLFFRVCFLQYSITTSKYLPIPFISRSSLLSLRQVDLIRAIMLSGRPGPAFITLYCLQGLAYTDTSSQDALGAMVVQGFSFQVSLFFSLLNDIWGNEICVLW
jgi:uncharacterized MnhB-related membrane protein